jgi:hypothetical protein
MGKCSSTVPPHIKAKIEISVMNLSAYKSFAMKAVRLGDTVESKFHEGKHQKLNNSCDEPTGKESARVPNFQRNLFRCLLRSQLIFILLCYKMGVCSESQTHKVEGTTCIAWVSFLCGLTVHIDGKL